MTAVIDGIKLRDYQEECIESTLRTLESHKSAIIVSATGTGKTVMIGELIRRWEGSRVIFMAHRDELVRQACDKISAIIGEPCDIEMGESRADSSIMYTRAKVIITSVQTMSRANRMARFDPHEFGLLVIDEAHHCPSPSYLAVIEHYSQNPALKIIGLTATPDRSDELALGRVFQAVAYEYELIDAIRDGWLVPIEQQFVKIRGLDLSAVKTLAGDLSQSELARIMEEEEHCHEVASASLQIANGPTLVFCSSVRHAELVSDILNRHKPGCAGWICGDALKCPIDVRRETLRRFSNGDFQFLVNCSVLLEGYDEPSIRTVVMARPTKSRSLYAQVIGRGTRPLPGVVDGCDTAEQRHAAIKRSQKPALLVVDLVGNSGRHKLINTGDILGGRYPEELVAKAVAAAKAASDRNERTNMLDAIRAAMDATRRAEREKRRKIIAKVKFDIAKINPFDVYDICAPRKSSFNTKEVPVWASRILERAKIPWQRLTYSEAVALAKEQIDRWNANKCTYKQAIVLLRAGYEDAKDFTFDEAKEEIDYLASHKWKRRPISARDRNRGADLTNAKEYAIMDDVDVPF